LFVEVLTVGTSLLALGWLWQAVAAWRGVPTLPDLTRLSASEIGLPATVPQVAVIVPACNEEDSVEATLRSLLASTGARLHSVAIDDRSSDRTGERMDAVAEEAEKAVGPHRLEVIHNRELPEGWLGKTHALALGAEKATAPWLLFTDGDVRFDPRAVSLALGYAEAERADHLVVVFTLEFQQAMEAATLAVFHALSQWSVRLWKVADPKARDFFGAGGFNLVRRDVYQALGGFASLRMEVLEDLRLGWKVKRAGYAQRVVLGPGLVRIRWIQGALGIVGLLEKNGFAASRFRLAPALAVLVAMSIQIFLPVVVIASLSWAALPGVLVYVFIAAAYGANRRITQVSPWLAVLFAPAAAILMYAVARSMVLAVIRGGVLWRGTLYPLKELRRNAGPLR
jgi:glycosyltransferase involved in cell wall biosynthesis